jgi:CheY-like chemotaxis protein
MQKLPLSQVRRRIDKANGRLLVVDDIEENRDLLKRQLMCRGYDVAVADSGQSALAAVARGNFDLVLLHIMMPGMSELETLERLRRISDRESLPVIMISANKESAEIELALGKGANDFITRPIDYPIAFARIETHLALKRAVDAIALTMGTNLTRAMPSVSVIGGKAGIKSSAANVRS